MSKYVGFVFRVLPIIFKKYSLLVKDSKYREKISFTKRYKDIKEMVTMFFDALNVKIIMTGIKNMPVEPSYLIAPNHQSLLDAVCFMSLMNQQTAFVAKKEAEHYPFVARAIKALDGVFLERDNLRQEIKAMQEIKKSMMTENKKWVIFPEGTRTRDPEFKVGEFKPGALKMAMNAKIDIYPVAMWGSFRVLDPKVNYLKKYPILIHVCEPITYEQYKDMSTTELAPYLRQIIVDKIEELKIKEKEYLDLYSKKRKN